MTLIEIREMVRSPASCHAAYEALMEAIKTPDDMLDFMEIYWQEDRKAPVPRQVRLVIQAVMNNFHDDDLMDTPDRPLVTFADLLKVSHVAPKNPGKALVFTCLIQRSTV